MSRMKMDIPRAELVRTRRTQETHQRLTQTQKTVYSPQSVYLPVTPRLVKQTRTHKGKPLQPTTKNSRRQRYDIAFSMGRTNVRTPGIAIPQFGTRMFSILMCAALIFSLYAIWTSSSFKVHEVEIRGNQRLGADEINAAVQFIGQPIFTVIPTQIAGNILANYPDLSSAIVHIGFPNRVIVNVAERIPVIAWYKDGTMAWIDANGIAFPPRGKTGDLISVVANGNPPSVQLDPQLTADPTQPFLELAMVQVIIALNSFIPDGAPMIYDMKYGLGWQDTRGWQVYFGQNTNEIPMKLKIYQAIVDSLSNKGIRPSLISVEYLNAPFYLATE